MRVVGLMAASTGARERVLAAGIAAVLLAGLVSVFVVEDDPGPLDQARAEACGMRLAQVAGYEPVAASARLDGAAWQISVVTSTEAVGLTLRHPDGRVIEAVGIGRSGSRPLDRESRLAIFERGC